MNTDMDQNNILHTAIKTQQYDVIYDLFKDKPKEMIELQSMADKNGKPPLLMSLDMLHNDTNDTNDTNNINNTKDYQQQKAKMSKLPIFIKNFVERDGANIFLTETQGLKRSAFHFACQSGDVPIINSMLKKAMKEDKSKALLLEKDSLGGIALHYAILSNKIKIVKMITDEAQRLGELNELMLALRYNQTVLEFASKKSQCEEIITHLKEIVKSVEKETKKLQTNQAPSVTATHILCQQSNHNNQNDKKDENKQQLSMGSKR